MAAPTAAPRVGSKTVMAIFVGVFRVACPTCSGGDDGDGGRVAVAVVEVVMV